MRWLSQVIRERRSEIDGYVERQREVRRERKREIERKKERERETER